MSELRVFAQSADTSIDIDAWNAHALRFFSTRLGLAEANAAHDLPARAELLFSHSRSGRSETGSATTTLRARFVIAPRDAPAGIRAASRRACEAVDLAEAESAEVASGTSGLALLARRCGALWLIEREGPDDALALRFAAILASLVLGPILDPDVKALFGVKTARAKMAALG